MDIYSPNSKAYKRRQKAQQTHKRDALIKRVYAGAKVGGVVFFCVCSFIFGYVVWC